MPEAPVAPGIRTVRVPDGIAGRIDRFVADATGLSRSHVQKLISDGRLTVDGAAVPLYLPAGYSGGRIGTRVQQMPQFRLIGRASCRERVFRVV